MAKKIRLDFSKTEKRSEWNTRQIPEGIYRAKIETLIQTEAQDGTAMLVYGFMPLDKPYITRRFPFYCKLQQNQLWKLRDLLIAAGESVPQKAVQIDPAKIVGKIVAIEIVDDNYQGNLRSTVSAVYAASVLEDVSEDETEDVSEDETEDDDMSEDWDEVDDFDDDEEDWEEEEPDPKPRKASRKKK